MGALEKKEAVEMVVRMNCALRWLIMVFLQTVDTNYGSSARGVRPQT
jgi:hypothetical protein